MTQNQPKYADEVLKYRPASLVMDINRLGTLYPYPLSFMRLLVRRIMREKWAISHSKFDLDDEGFGDAIYEIITPNKQYNFIVFAKYLAPENRSDRVIAEQWDLTMTLCAGKLNPERLERLRVNVPLQEMGRVDSDCFVLSRANKSARNFNSVINDLSAGSQPDLDVMAKVGYIYRTTAVYGSGKLGMADWEKVQSQFTDFGSPFAAEMFCCFLLRQFSLDQADHVARRRSPKTAVPMADGIKRYVGIGNATGLGMAPFLIHHPLLISNWIEIRETALARVLTRMHPDGKKIDGFEKLAHKAIRHLGEISTDNNAQNEINTRARDELLKTLAWIKGQTLSDWSTLTNYALSNLGTETQELINTLLCELYPDVHEDLEEKFGAVEVCKLIPEMKNQELLKIIEKSYDWALSYDYSDISSKEMFWYRSAEKMEPRLGNRNTETGADQEMFICISGAVQSCYQDLQIFSQDNPNKTAAHFCFSYPKHRLIVRRIQTMSQKRYGEIRVNLLDKNVLPIHLLRCKLSFFGVGKFDPRSRLWVRNTMFQGAPLVSDIGNTDYDQWCFPIRPEHNAQS